MLKQITIFEKIQQQNGDVQETNCEITKFIGEQHK